VSIRLVVDDILWSQKGFPMETTTDNGLNIYKHNVLASKARIRTTHYQPDDSFKVRTTVNIYDEDPEHILKINDEDFNDVIELAKSKTKFGFVTRKHGPKSEYYPDGKSAIGVEFDIDDNEVILHVMVGLPKKKFSPEKVLDRWSMSISRSIFDNYCMVISNNIFEELNSREIARASRVFEV